MSESKRLICDICGQMTVREGYAVPMGWMHIEAWYRPDDAESECSGCTGMDLCPECIRKSGIVDELADRCVSDYDKNVKRKD